MGVSIFQGVFFDPLNNDWHRQVNVSANSNREPTLGAETVRKNKTQEWLPENFLQPVDEEEVATKVPAPFYCAPLVASKGEVGLIWLIFLSGEGFLDKFWWWEISETPIKHNFSLSFLYRWIFGKINPPSVLWDTIMRQMQEQIRFSDPFNSDQSHR